MYLPELAGGTGLLLLTAINAPISPWISRKIVNILIYIIFFVDFF